MGRTGSEQSLRRARAIGKNCVCLAFHESFPTRNAKQKRDCWGVLSRSAEGDARWQCGGDADPGLGLGGLRLHRGQLTDKWIVRRLRLKLRRMLKIVARGNRHAA